MDGRLRCGALRDAVRTEWTKARTSPATWPLLGALVVLTVAVGALAAGSVDGRPGTDAAKTALTGVHLGLAVAAVLALGTAAVVRDPGASVGCVLALLYLFPVAAALVDDPVWQRRLVRVGPTSAGLGVRTTVPDAVRALPIGPWAGLAVAAGWAAGALLAGVWALRARDV
ncbi:hypothetical protein [Actinacidiphila sp. bgisy145]|uniref:hypothetical protein n=1 Tax=Actinacidiphila sp. bgisy145 TaxID=3413792 RepID=UPI003EB772C6